MSEKKRTSARVRAAARERMAITGESYTAALAAVIATSSDRGDLDHLIAAANAIAYDDDDEYDDDEYDIIDQVSLMGDERYEGEDDRTLNGLHIVKAINGRFDVHTINEKIPGAGIDRADTVDTGGWFELTPVILCTINATSQWRIQLLRSQKDSPKTSVINSMTYRWGRIDDAYGPSLIALLRCYEFLVGVQRGEHRHWKTPEAGARAIFPPPPVVGYYWQMGHNDPGDLTPLELVARTISWVVETWVDLAERWSHWLENWPMADQFETLQIYFEEHPEHDRREMFFLLQREYRRTIARARRQSGQP